MSDDIMKERALRVEEALRLLQGNKDNLGNIPGILRQLVTMRVWEGYDWKGNTITFGSFQEFVETPLPEGLGTTISELIGYCKKYPEIADLIDQIVVGQKTVYRPPESVYNVHTKKRSSGNSLQRSLRRLRTLAQNDPKVKNLQDQVFRCEISANQALTQLGIRHRRFGLEHLPIV